MPAVGIGEIADFLEARYGGDRRLEIRGVRPLSVAGPHELSFLSNPRYAAQLEESRAGAVLVSDDHPGEDPRYVRVAKPYFALSRVLQRWFAAIPLPDPGVSADALVHPTAEVAGDVRIAPFATVAAGARIGAGAVLFEGVRIGAGVTIGEGAVLHPNVVVYHGCSVGRRSILHSGVVIGADGFGYATEDGVHHKIPQIGSVRVGDDVEIGANTTIDRGALDDTVIGDGSKIDNLVTVGHGARTGRGCILVAQVGISGSTELGDHVVMGGQAGAAGHLTIASGAQVAARAAVMKSVTRAGVWAGVPARPLREYQKTEAALRRIGSLIRRVRAVEEAVGVTRQSGEWSGNDSLD